MKRRGLLYEISQRQIEIHEPNSTNDCNGLVSELSQILQIKPLRHVETKVAKILNSSFVLPWQSK